jgi:hypothetical protein
MTQELYPPDFRELCAELVEALEKCQRPYGDEPESSLVWKARAAAEGLAMTILILFTWAAGFITGLVAGRAITMHWFK